MAVENIPAILACDCGNSGIRIAMVHGENVSGLQIFRLGGLAGLGKAVTGLLAQADEPKKIVAVSVNPVALKALEAAVLEASGEHVLVVGRDLPLPINMRVKNPDSVGADRLCAAVAAFDHLGRACVVADFGTAVTIDCVNDEGVFLGGSILPGLRMGATALATQTVKLPEVKLEQPDWVYGGDTREAILAGLIYGARGALRERVEAYATELGIWPLLILTGADANLICPNTADEGFVQAIVEDLTLRGAAMAYYKTLTK